VTLFSLNEKWSMYRKTTTLKSVSGFILIAGFDLIEETCESIYLIIWANTYSCTLRYVFPSFNCLTSRCFLVYGWLYCFARMHHIRLFAIPYL